MATSSSKKWASPYILLLLAVLVVTIPIGLIKFTEYYKQTSAVTKVHDELTSRLRMAGRHRALASVEEACSYKNSCECSNAQIREALNADFHELSLSILDGRKCQDPGEGVRAEALARAGQFQEVAELAQRALALNQSDPFALYALAHVAHFADGGELALERVQAAVAAQRGAPPYLLAFLHHYKQDEWEPAQRAVESILEIDSQDPDALYNLALIHHKRDDYLAAREGYLKLLAVVPEHANARYNLGVLTHSVGALDEAKHNLAKLTAIVGKDDERVNRLQAVIDGPPAPLEKRFAFDRGLKPAMNR